MKIKKILGLSLLAASSASAALVVETAPGFESGGAVTNAVAATFTVSEGDVIAVVAAGNGGTVLPDNSASLSASGVTFTYLYKPSGGGPVVASWYGTATVSGTINVLFTTAGTGNLSLGLHHLSCDAGYVVERLDSVAEGTTSATNLSATYDFGSTFSEAILLEAASSYGVFQNLPALDANKNNADKFIARHETVTNVSGATSTYNLLTANKIAVAGLAFAEVELPLPLVGPENFAIRYVGRFTDDYQFGWSGTMIETDFTGSTIQADLELVPDPEAGLTVVIDGVPRFVHADSGTTTYTLAENLEVGIPHRIQIFKRSEGAKGTFQFKGFRIADDGSLSRPDAPARKMLVIGDSITCGYGNEALDVADGNTVENQNGYMSYAPIAARTLGADIMMFSWSGKGMYRNGTDANLNTIPEMFNQTLPEDASPQWDHSQYVPDVIVINLGTNDKRDTNPDRDPLTDFETEFKQAYTNFIGRLRGYYPDSEIVLSIGPMGMGPVGEWLPAIASNFTDTSVHIFSTFTGVEEKGGHHHPNVPKDISMAAELVDAITLATDWTPHAQHLVNFQFSEAAGTDWINATNRGSDSAVWHKANSDTLTDGSWHAHITPTTNAFINCLFTTPVTSGVVTVECRLDSWALTNSVAGSGVKFGVNSWTAKISFDNDDATRTKVRGIVSLSSGTTSASGYIDGQSSSNGVTLRQVVDLDASGGPTVSLSYKPEGTDGFVRLITDQAYLDATNGIASVRFFQEGTTPWTGGDYIDLDRLTVSVTPSASSPAALWNNWLTEFPTLGTNTNLLDNADGDDWINLVEYALGGNPSSPDSATIFQVLETGGTNYIEYVYPRRTDANSRGLSYQVLHTTNLLQAVWTSNRFEFAGSGAIDADFESVTHRISTEVENQLFVKLQVEQF